jgi:hypothetical protein
MLVHRLALLVTAYLSASVVAAPIVLVGFLLASESQVDVSQILPAIFYAPSALAIATAAVALLALVPTLVAVFLLRRTGTRSAYWYVVTGALVGLITLGTYCALLRWMDGANRPAPLSDPRVARVLMAVVASVVLAGGCAGLTFWAIARQQMRARRARLKTTLD